MTPQTGEFELPAGPQSLVARAGAEVAQNLPAWFFLAHSVLLLNTGLTNFSPPRESGVFTVLFPLSVFVLFTLVRVWRAPELDNRWLVLLGSLAPAVSLPLMVLAWHRPSPVQGESLLFWCELSNFVWAAALVWHATRAGRGHLALFFGTGLLYGALLENGGIVLGFFHEANLTLTLVPPLVAPVSTMIGWCIVLYMATFVVWKLRTWIPLLRESNALSAVLVAGAATLLDLQADPLATAAGCWVWDSTLPPFFLGVPLMNFVAWMCALWPFAWLMFRWQGLARISDGGGWSRRDLKAMTLRVPYALALASVLFAISVALLEGFSGPTFGIFYRFTALILGL
jgi:hypothetical protein